MVSLCSVVRQAGQWFLVIDNHVESKEFKTTCERAFLTGSLGRSL